MKAVRWIRLLAVAAIMLAVLAYGVLFAVANDTPVAVDLLFAQLPQARLYVWLFLAFAGGGLLGLLASSASLLQARGRQLMTRRQLAKTEQELEKARASSR